MNTKSVGTSTSSRTRSITSSPRLGLSSLSKIKVSCSKPVDRPSSFSSAEVGPTCTIKSDPYVVGFRTDNQQPPPYSLDEVSYRSYLPLYQLGPMDPKECSTLLNPCENPCTNRLPKFTGPSIPTIDEIDNKIGLTPSEREDIIDSLLRMKRLVDCKTEIDRKGFLEAQSKLKELLLDAESRLTEEEKEEFVNEARRIKEIKNDRDLKRLENEKKYEAKKGIDDKENDSGCYCDLWSIFFKVIQLTVGMFIYVENKKLRKDDLTSTHLLILLCFVTGMFSSCFLLLYLFGRRPSRSMLLYECVYCILCTISYSITSIFQFARSITIMLLCFGMVGTFILDLVRKICLFEWKSVMQDGENLTTTRVSKDIYNTPKRKNLHNFKSNTYGSVSKNIFMTKNRILANPFKTDNIKNATVLNLDFLDEANPEDIRYLQNRKQHAIIEGFSKISDRKNCNDISTNYVKENEKDICKSDDYNINSDNGGTTNYDHSKRDCDYEGGDISDDFGAHD